MKVPTESRRFETGSSVARMFRGGFLIARCAAYGSFEAFQRQYRWLHDGGVASAYRYQSLGLDSTQIIPEGLDSGPPARFTTGLEPDEAPVIKVLI